MLRPVRSGASPAQRSADDPLAPVHWTEAGRVPADRQRIAGRHPRTTGGPPEARRKPGGGLHRRLPAQVAPQVFLAVGRGLHRRCEPPFRHLARSAWSDPVGKPGKHADTSFPSAGKRRAVPLHHPGPGPGGRAQGARVSRTHEAQPRPRARGGRSVPGARRRPPTPGPTTLPPRSRPPTTARTPAGPVTVRGRSGSGPGESGPFRLSNRTPTKPLPDHLQTPTGPAAPYTPSAVPAAVIRSSAAWSARSRAFWTAAVLVGRQHVVGGLYGVLRRPVQPGQHQAHSKPGRGGSKAGVCRARTRRNLDHGPRGGRSVPARHTPAVRPGAMCCHACGRSGECGAPAQLGTHCCGWCTREHGGRHGSSR